MPPAMEPLQRIALVSGIIAGLATIYSFATRLPNPLNYSLFTLTVIVLLIAAIWHGLPSRPKATLDSREVEGKTTRTKKLYDKSFVVKRGEYEPFQFDCVRGDIVSISAKSDGKFNWYIFRPGPFSKYREGRVRLSPDDGGSNVLEEEKDFKARTYGPFFLVVENATNFSISVRLHMVLTHSKL
jgi:hypothetical protein